MVEIIAADMVIRPAAPNIIPRINDKTIEIVRLTALLRFAAFLQVGNLEAKVSSTAAEHIDQRMTRANIIVHKHSSIFWINNQKESRPDWN